VVPVPVDVVVVDPFDRVNVHVPEDGKPLNATEPVDTAQVGWVIVPTTGAAMVGTALITTLADKADVHPAAFCTVNLYVNPAGRLPTVVVAPVPVDVVVVDPFDRVNIHVPEDGNPLNATEPVGTAQVGWVIVPTAGAGMDGTALITTLADKPDEHPAALLTVNL
jgi:hypothetical protein